MDELLSRSRNPFYDSSPLALAFEMGIGALGLPPVLQKIEHIALAVSNLDDAIRFYEAVWGLEVVHRERVDEQGIEEAMLPLGESFLQLVAPTRPDSPVGKFIARRGEGLHHVAYEVDDLKVAMAQLESNGVQLVNETPRRGGRGHTVAFVHPGGNFGVLVELIQRR
jgi:methylmalonyl-CoA/ethylmalonyl-CoA epimerase